MLEDRYLTKRRRRTMNLVHAVLSLALVGAVTGSTWWAGMTWANSSQGTILDSPVWQLELSRTIYLNFPWMILFCLGSGGFFFFRAYLLISDRYMVWGQFLTYSRKISDLEK